jgi:hypothetical protein
VGFPKGARSDNPIAKDLQQLLDLSKFVRVFFEREMTPKTHSVTSSAGTQIDFDDGSGASQQPTCRTAFNARAAGCRASSVDMGAISPAMLAQVPAPLQYAITP